MLLLGTKDWADRQGSSFANRGSVSACGHPGANCGRGTDCANVEWLKVYCSGVNLQAETASANARRRDAAPFWTWPRNQHRSASISRTPLPPSSLSAIWFPQLGRVLARWQRQQRDSPQHRSDPPSRRMPRGQQQPVVTCMLHQPSSSLHQPLLQTGQRPILNPSRQTKPPP